MSEKEESIDSNKNDEKIKVYDNDDAYLFGDASLNESNEENDDKNDENENNTNNENDIIYLNEFSKKVENNENNLEKEKINYETPKNDQNSEINNNNETDQIEEDNNYNNYISPGNNSKDAKEDQLLTNKKYIINDITTDMENEQDYEDSSIKSKENKNINNNKYNNNEKSSVNENDSNESEIPLITLNFLSICQCCKNQFNSQNNVPYLFKCGHFFCKQCINEQFTDEEGIKCPNDGLIAKYLSELKILNNFINDKNAEKNIKIKYKEKYCEYHKGQKLSHYIENSKELICVYCAFERFKSNPGVEIKDINEKCKSMENKIDNIIDDNQHNVEIIQNALRDIKLNKENEEKKINDVFNDLFEILKIKKEELRVKIENIFTDNAKKLSQKLEIFSNKLEKSEKIKNNILYFKSNQEELSFSQIIEIYDNFIKEMEDINRIILQKYKLKFDNILELKERISKFGEFELTEKNCNFLGNTMQTNIKEDIQNTNNNNNKNNNQAIIRVNKEINLKYNNSYKIDNFYHFINNNENQIKNEISSISNKSQKNNNKPNINNTGSLNDQKINSTIQNTNQMHLNINKSSGNIKINNNKKINNNSKSKISKKYINNKNANLLDMTSSTYGNSLSKNENHNTGGFKVHKPISNIQKYKYNLSLGQNYSFNNIPYINSVSNNYKINNIRINTKKNKNSNSKNNKSITTPSRINLKKDNK